MRRVFLFIVLIILGVLLLMFLAAGFIVAFITVSGWLSLHHALGTDTQSSENYAFASGTGPMIITSLGFSAGLLTIWKHINCEYPNCPWPGHRHPDHGRPVCRKHYHHDVIPSKPSS